MMTYTKCRLQQFRGDILKPEISTCLGLCLIPHIKRIETLDVVLASLACDDIRDFLTQTVDAKPRASLTVGEHFLVLLKFHI